MKKILNFAKRFDVKSIGFQRGIGFRISGEGTASLGKD
jgi:hypothetical protein